MSGCEQSVSSSAAHLVRQRQQVASDMASRARRRAAHRHSHRPRKGQHPSSKDVVRQVSDTTANSCLPRWRVVFTVDGASRAAFIAFRFDVGSGCFAPSGHRWAVSATEMKLISMDNQSRNAKRPFSSALGPTRGDLPALRCGCEPRSVLVSRIALGVACLNCQ